MGRCVLKAAPDRDLYLIWSSVVDAPVFIGNRAEILAELVRDGGRHSHPDRVMRGADETGSSDRLFGFGCWDDDALPVGEGSPDDGWYHLRRGRLLAYAEALMAGDEATAVGLLERYDEVD